MRINQIITERYVNLIGDDPRKSRYQDQVWSILNHSYASIGGLRGSASDLQSLAKLPFWKLAVKDGRVIAVVLYKDKNGRKAVATGTDGSMAGKQAIGDIIRQEPKRSYAEKSKSSLSLFMKSFSDPTQYLIPVHTVRQVLPNKQITPIKNQNPDRWPVSDAERDSIQKTLSRYPELADYGYFREIDGETLFKVMVGTPNLPIK